MHSIHSLESLRVQRIWFRLHFVISNELIYLMNTYPALLATARCLREGSKANALDYWIGGQALIELAPPNELLFMFYCIIIEVFFIA